MNEIHHLITKNDFDILGVNETWLSDAVSDHELKLPGYDILRNDRNRHGGGVCLYIKDTIQYHRRSDIDETTTESIWIRCPNKQDTVNIAVIYRPPSANSAYYDNILNQIELIKSEDEHLILMGDLNYDYLQTPNAINFIETAYDMKQLVQSPTRETVSSRTLIDVIISSCPEDHINTQVMDIALSDHYLVCTTLLTHYGSKQCDHRLVSYRDYKKLDTTAFYNDLLNCTSIVNCDFKPEDVHKHWESFKTNFIRICDKHAPICRRRLKRRFNPWIDADIVNNMYKRDHVKTKAVRTGDPVLFEEYKRLRNHVNSSINNAKKTYYNKELQCNAGKPKKIWSLIRKLTNSNKDNEAPEEISPNDFNDYFASVGQNVSDLCDKNMNSNNFKGWKGPKSSVLFKFISIECTTVIKYFKKLDNKSSTDVLSIDSKMLIIAADIIAPVLTKMFNICIMSGHVLDDWKYARVTPIYKGKGEKSDPCNYRPISVISHIAKVFEKVVQLQMMSYLIENNFISIDQSAYRKHHNTQTCLHRVVDDWLENVGDNLLTGVCLLDIKKCFDSINHELLLYKLDCYGIRENESRFFSSYLSNRKQAVKCKEIISNDKMITVGVPQGSVLGPILFMMFINDISQHIHLGTANLYADDCIIYCSGVTFDDVQSNLQKCIDDVSLWYAGNKLVLNAEKSNSMLITSKYKHQNVLNDKELEIIINDCKIRQVKNCEYLGITIEESLSWEDHINKLCSSLTRKVGMLSRLRKSTPQDIMKRIYMSTVQPCIDYAISIWGNTTNINLDKVQRIQNYAARVITSQFDYINVRGIEIVNALGWFNVRQRFYYFNVLLMFKCIHGLAPLYISNNVLMECEMVSRSLRSCESMNIYVPYCENFYQSKTFATTAGKFWNNLPKVLQNICDITLFKSELKKFIHGASFTYI